MRAFSPLFSKPGNHLVLWAEGVSEIVHIITYTHICAVLLASHLTQEPL